MTASTHPECSVSAAPQQAEWQDDVYAALRTVSDPELGVNIVDLGLVYGVSWAADGIRARITVTSPSCPMADLLSREVELALRKRFPGTPAIHVDVVRDPPWSPARISDQGRQLLGWTPRVRTRRDGWWSTLLGRNAKRQ
jgi:metal-sulfur cluster biosynthetic enzyme